MSRQQISDPDVADMLVNWLIEQVPALAQHLINQAVEPLKGELDRSIREIAATALNISKVEVRLGRLIVTWNDGREIDAGLVQGEDGRSVSRAVIDDAGELTLHFVHKGRESHQNLGRVMGRDGRDVREAWLDGRHLVLRYSDGEEADLGVVVGRDGHSLATASLLDDGRLVLSVLRDGGKIDHINVGKVVGRDGVDGVDGKPGARGIRGLPGPAGRGVTALNVRDGDLHVVYDDGQTRAVGRVAGQDGRDGVSIAGVRLSAAGHLVVKLSDKRVVDLGVITGPRGEKGDRGDTGLPGSPGLAGQAGPGFRWRGPWQREATYYAQPDNPDGPYADVIEFEGVSYVCNTSTSSQPPGRFWDVFAKGGGR